jgi:hypothetical protein
MGVTEMGKMSSGLPFMPLYYSITLFWHFLAPQGGPLGGPTQLLTIIFQLSQSREVVWKNKIQKILTG